MHLCSGFRWRLMRPRLKQDSQIMIDKMVTLPKGKIARRIGSLSEAQMLAVNNALMLFLGLADAEAFAASSKLQ